VTADGVSFADEHLLRELTPQVLGAVIRRFGDFGAAEDAVQEALLAASQQWPKTGKPDNPRGWLIHVAARRMTDHLRSERSRRLREAAATDSAVAHVAPDVSLPSLAFLATGQAATNHHAEQDDTLILLFMCCHPSLTSSSAIALTLRAVGGLTTAEIAKAFLVPESTMAQRISRAKQTIRTSDVPFDMPAPGDQAERLAVVLHVLYLIFNEGYTSSFGARLQRTELSSEAIRLTRALHELCPNEPEVAGLLALMVLTDARKAARTGADGDLIPLDKQDRTLWDRHAIDEGVALISATLSKGAVGPYQLQAAIAAVHDEARAAEDTDWSQILALYGLLKRMSDNPMVALNHAIAVGMVHGPRAGLDLLQELGRDDRLAGHYRIDAVRAHLLERAGEREAAIECYRVAAERTTNIPERDYLLAQAARLARRV
jgi:RNA polymerase sigma factor (sigma-70 family)